MVRYISFVFSPFEINLALQLIVVSPIFSAGVLDPNTRGKVSALNFIPLEFWTNNNT